MFDVSWGELVLVGVVALIVIGPKELPTVLRTAGQWMTKMRRMAAEFQGQFHEAMREAEFAELKQQVESIADTTRNLGNFDPLDSAQKEIDTALKGETGTTPSGEPPAETPAAVQSAEPPAAEPAETAVSPSGEPAATVAETTAPASDPAKPAGAEGGRAA